MRTLAVLLLALTCLGVFVPAAPAATVSLGIDPMRFEDELKPGDTVSHSITASNPGTAPLQVSAATADYRIGANGVPAFTPPGNPFAAGSWLQVEPAVFQLAPGEKKLITITVRVPRDSAPGGHYGAVLFQFGGGASEGTGVGVSGRIASVEMITIPGDIIKAGSLQALAIPLLSSGYPVPIALSLKNTGNIHLPQDGNIVIDNWLGGKVAAIPIPSGYVFPKSVKDIKLTLPSGSMFGFYRADVSFNEQAIAVDRTAYFIILPWPLILGIILVAYGLYKLGLARGRKGSSDTRS